MEPKLKCSKLANLHSFVRKRVVRLIIKYVDDIYILLRRNKSRNEFPNQRFELNVKNYYYFILGFQSYQKNPDGFINLVSYLETIL